jgi:regulator of protease activity HflC (stomatin/prohibitin superfamily)
MNKIIPALTLIGILIASWLVWEWGFCRFYVPPNQMAILVAKMGKPLEPGQILAKKGQQGIQEEVLGEGRHFRNPLLYEWKIMPNIIIPPGKIGIVTSKIGKDLPPGEFLADEGQKGIQRKILGPGKYRYNPQGYSIDVVDALMVPIGYVGVVTSLDGKNPQEGSFAEFGERGVRKIVLQPGIYFINPKQYKIDAVEIGINQISLLEETGGKNIEFPSKDGFEIKLDTTVEFELLPEHIPSTFSKYGNFQAVVDKIILPQILSISRLKGSAYGARDFIVGEGREKFQEDFNHEIENTLEQKNIEIRSALIRHVTIPDQILTPIQDASIAQLRNLTNIEKQTTAKKLAELNTEKSLIDQRKEQIQQETKKLKAEIKAEQDKEVAQINAETQRQFSEIEKDTALIKAEITRKLGKVDADISQMIGQAKADGFRLKVEAFKDPTAYSLYSFAAAIPNDLKIAIAHSGPGTLWTDLGNASSGSLGSLKILQNNSSNESASPQEPAQ